MTHTKRERDAILRNGRPTKQMRLCDRKMPSKGTLITIKHSDKDNIEHIRQIVEKYGLKVKFVVPSTTEGGRSKAMEHERKLLTKRRMLEETAKKKFDELDVIFQQIHETDLKIIEQLEKQTKEIEQ